MSLDAGAKLGRYEIRSKLGEGGMGEVYLAHDTGELDRTVALKFLPAEVTGDAQRLHRFIQEARTVSRLNHPNILTVYDFGQADGVRFIATEYVDGVTLRKHVSGRRLRLHDVLDLAVQIADALSAAHEAGVVHRDVKPENVMVRRRDSIVKVLDFGLAKPTEKAGAQAPSVDTEAGTRLLVNTEPGLVMGTVAYMSPEQSRGLPVDARTDIWSLGVVLYEALAGRLPFEGSDVHRQIIAIQEQEPPPLSQHVEGVPERLEEIVTKALAKDPGERYQTAKDLLIDLRRLKQKLEAGAAVDRTFAPEARNTAGGSRGNTLQPTAPGEPRPTSSAEYIISEIKKHRRGVLVAVTLVAAAGVALGVVLYRLARDRAAGQGQAAGAAAPQIKITPFVVNGVVNIAAISPDGKYVAYVLSDEAKGENSVWLRHLPTASDVQIIPPSRDRYGVFVFSRDGNYISYRLFPDGGGPSSLNKIPVVGGTPKRLIADFKTNNLPWSFSPDGRQVTFIREEASGETKLIVANEDGTDERVLLSRKGSEGWLDGWPAWSPDGKVIALYGGSYAGGIHRSLMTVRLEDGSEQQVGAGKWFDAWYLLWLPDGGGLLVNGRESQTGPGQVWRVSYPEGSVSRLTNDLNTYVVTSLTADASTMLAFQDKTYTDIWTAPAAPSARPRQVTFTKADGLWGVTWAPDGRIVFGSTAGGGQVSIWVMNADGSGRRQLTSGANDWSPSVSPDGRHVVFQSTRSGPVNVWRVDMEGRDLRQLTSHGSEDNRPRHTSDGKWITFGSWRTGKLTVWKMPAEGGEAVQLSDRGCIFPSPSPDGRFVNCVDREERMDAAEATRVLILPIEGGAPARVVELPPKSLSPIRWTPDGRGLAFVRSEGGAQNVWRMPLEGGRPVQLTGFEPAPGAFIPYFAYSPDGRALAVARSTSASELVLITNFK